MDILKIISPGVLPNGLTLEALKSGIYQRFTRNEYIINFASKIFSNIAESLGSGINRIKEICNKGSYKEPKYFITDNEVRVIYYKNEGIKPEDEGINLEKFIKSNHGLRVSQISKIINIPKKTLERWIKKLKSEGKIIFKGSNKTGGYYFRD